MTSDYNYSWSCGADEKGGSGTAAASDNGFPADVFTRDSVHSWDY